MDNKKRIAAIMQPLGASDPRNWDHPSHREAWLKLAYAIGEAMAQQEWERLHGKEIGDTDEDSGPVREVFERSAKRSLH